MQKQQAAAKHPLVYVKESDIHGNGLFAKRNIKAGQVIGQLKGKPTLDDGPYVLWIDNVKKGFKVECIFKYINHKKKANACYFDDLTVVALTDISKGDEITHDYGEDWED